MKNSRMGNKEAKGSERKTQRSNSRAEAAAPAERTVEVLYQKMGDRWFAFSLIDDEVFFGSIHPSDVSKEKSKKLAGQS